jgi:hypothetical protein
LFPGQLADQTHLVFSPLFPSIFSYLK